MSYVNDLPLLEALLDSHASGNITIELHTLFTHIIDLRVNRYLQHNVQQHELFMKDACMIKLRKIWHNYKFKRDKPFAYFVSVVDNAIKLYYITNQIQFVSIDGMNTLYAEN